MRAVVHIGDCREVLATLPGASVHCVVTSPPYFGLRDYKCEGQIGLEKSPSEYVAEMVGVFEEIKRVLRDDGTVWLNIGDSFAANRGQQVPPTKWPSLDFGASNASSVPDGFKAKDLLGIPWRLAFALQAAGWYLRSDIIWCLSGGAKVYARTQKGDMPITVKDLVRLRPETVKLWNGEKWTQALGWSRSQDAEGALEIELRSGERIGCTRGHQWPTDRGLLRADEIKPGDVIDWSPLPEPDEPKGAALCTEVAWMCGLYLAEGSMSGDKVQFAGHSDQTTARLRRLQGIAEGFHGSARVHTDGNSANIVLSGPVIASVIRAYVHGNSAKNKGIKVRAWARDNRWLEQFLMGYMDGDGHYDSENERWRLAFTRNDRLAGDLRTLAARLDLPLRLAPTAAKAFGREWPIYKGELRYTRSTHHNARRDTEVVAIHRSRARQFWDIGVEDEPHTFALASGVLTHNSKPNPMPESVQDRPTRSHEYVFLLTKSAKYFYDIEAVREPHSRDWFNESVGEKYMTPQDGRNDGGKREGDGTPAGRNKRTVWTVTPRPFPLAHFATFPEELVEPCIFAGTSEHGCCVKCGNPWKRTIEPTPEYAQHLGKDWADDEIDQAEGRGHFISEDGAVATQRRVKRNAPSITASYVTKGWQPSCTCNAPTVPCTVLDPFSGAGTTGLVAVKHGRNYVGIELNPSYVEMSERRIRNAAPLFVTVTTQGAGGIEGGGE